jgi:hypothetical protein
MSCVPRDHAPVGLKIVIVDWNMFTVDVMIFDFEAMSQWRRSCSLLNVGIFGVVIGAQWGGCE